MLTEPIIRKCPKCRNEGFVRERIDDKIVLNCWVCGYTEGNATPTDIAPDEGDPLLYSTGPEYPY